MNKTRGFTLIELLVVIVILGVLIGYVAPNYFNQLQQSKVSVARTQIYAFENALDRYRIDIGKYPETRQGLSALVTQPAGIVNWNGPYLRKAIPKDPWGSDYQYRKADDEKAIILSLGADKKAGGQNTDADITNN